MIYKYKGFSVKIIQDGDKWRGTLYGLNISFEGDTEEAAVAEFHRIADEHLLEPD